MVGNRRQVVPKTTRLVCRIEKSDTSHIDRKLIGSNNEEHRSEHRKRSEGKPSKIFLRLLVVS